MSLGMQPPVCRSSAFCQAHIRYSLKDASQWMPLGLPLPRSFLFAGQAGPLNEAVGPPDRHHGWPLASSFPAVRRHANAGLGGRRRSSMGVPWLFVFPPYPPLASLVCLYLLGARLGVSTLGRCDIVAPVRNRCTKLYPLLPGRQAEVRGRCVRICDTATVCSIVARHTFGNN